MCNLLILFIKPLWFFLEHLVIRSRLSLVAPGLSPLCTRGQCLPGSDSHFYLKRPELWDREGEHVLLATAVRVSLGEADQVITPTFIFYMLSWTNKILELNFKLLFVLQLRHRHISPLQIWATWLDKNLACKTLALSILRAQIPEGISIFEPLRCEWKKKSISLMDKTNAYVH